MKIKLFFSFMITILCMMSCFTNEPSTQMTFLGQNPYEYPVWKEMINLEVVNMKDLDAAYNAYASTHDIDASTAKDFQKLKKRMRGALDINGNYRSFGLQYEDLMERRASRRDMNKEVNSFHLSSASFSMDIPNPTGTGSWKNIGPFGNPDVHWTATGNGAMQYLEMHPTNPAIMYACSRNGGLWKTINNGNHWEPLTGHFATPHTSCVEVCKADPTILYLGAAEDKMIWYTSDEGMTWVNRSLGIDGDIYDIHSDPTNAARAIASTTKGVYLTTNSGMTWTQKVAGEFTDMRVSSTLDFMVISKNSDNIAPTLFFSKDKGDTWIEENIITTPATVDRFHIAIHEPTTGPIQVFAYGVINGHTPGRFIGLWKSKYDPLGSGGVYFNFTEVKHPTYAYPNGAVVLRWKSTAPFYEEQSGDPYGGISPFTNNTWASDFWVSPTDSNRMITLTEKFWGSDDGGIIWDFKPSYGGSNWADMRFFTHNVAKDTVYFLNDGGMWALK